MTNCPSHPRIRLKRAFRDHKSSYSKMKKREEKRFLTSELQKTTPEKIPLYFKYYFSYLFIFCVSSRTAGQRNEVFDWIECRRSIGSHNWADVCADSQQELCEIREFREPNRLGSSMNGSQAADRICRLLFLPDAFRQGRC